MTLAHDNENATFGSSVLFLLSAPGYALTERSTRNLNAPGNGPRQSAEVRQAELSNSGGSRGLDGRHQWGAEAKHQPHAFAPRDELLLVAAEFARNGRKDLNRRMVQCCFLLGCERAISIQHRTVSLWVSTLMAEKSRGDIIRCWVSPSSGA